MTIYRWTDANGVEHFSDQKPAGRSADVAVPAGQGGNALGHVVSARVLAKQARDRARIRKQANDVDEKLNEESAAAARKYVEDNLAPVNRTAEKVANLEADQAANAALSANRATIDPLSKLASDVSNTNRARIGADRASDVAGAVALVTPVGVVGGVALGTGLNALNSPVGGNLSVGDQAVTTGGALSEAFGSEVGAGAFKAADVAGVGSSFFEGPDLLPTLDTYSLDELDALEEAVRNTDNTRLAQYGFGATDKQTLLDQIEGSREKLDEARAADARAAEARDRAGKLYFSNVADEGTAIQKRMDADLVRRLGRAGSR